MSYKCPHCEESIEYLNYRTEGYSYGDYDIGNGHYDESGCEFEGDTYFECPECSWDIPDPEELELVEEEDEERPEDPGDKIIKIIQPQAPETMILTDHTSSDAPRGFRLIQCPKCKTKNMFELMESMVNCTNCNKELIKKQ